MTLKVISNVISRLVMFCWLLPYHASTQLRFQMQSHSHVQTSNFDPVRYSICFFCLCTICFKQSPIVADNDNDLKSKIDHLQKQL